MAVVGVDIGDYATYISVARLGAVETISNDYSLRATPSIVAIGDRQRYVGVSAENQRNLNPKNTVSFFKNTIGRTLKNIQPYRYGAKVIKDEQGHIVFEILNRKLSPEQILGAVFTKVGELVRSVEGEEIDTLVVSVPVYFTQAQRAALRDAAQIAGLRVQEILTDTSALALGYGKNKSLEDGEVRHVVLVDSGSHGTQAVLAKFTGQSAEVLASSYNLVGGRVFDDLLLDHAVSLVEAKYKVTLGDNLKARNKLRNSLEKTKKQMSANTNPIPVQLDSLVDDIDVQFTVDRAQFEALIGPSVVEVRGTLENLLRSTTLRPEEIHSVEMVGGSTRIPLLKKTIQDVFGLVPSTTLNADEAVSRGCALHAASISNKFITKKFEVKDCVHAAVEAVFVHGGRHEKVIICDEGDSVDEEKKVEITADLPLNVALQYTESSPLEDRFISLYKVERTEPPATGLINLKFKFDKCGVLELKESVLVSEESNKKRRKSGSVEREESSVPSPTVLPFSQSMPEPRNLGELVSQEAEMVAADKEEIARQEEKNRLEEELYKTRHSVQDKAEQVKDEAAYQNLVAYFDEIETWLYEEGEDAPRSTYLETLKSLRTKMKVYSVWFDKFMLMKEKEAEKRSFLEQQERGRDIQRQIPVVYEGEDEYVPKQRADLPTRFAHRRDPFQRGFGRSSFFDGSMFDPW